jgi:hypothetical protein
MPYFAHYGMWNDVLVVHLLLALFAARYWGEWVTQLWVLLPIATASIWLAWWANDAWVKDTSIIQSHAEVAEDKIHSTGHMSLVGWIHVLHMAIIVTIIAMMCVTLVFDRMPLQLAAGAVCVLVGHAAAGQHPHLRLEDKEWNPWPKMGYEVVLAASHIVLTLVGIVIVLTYFFG